MNSCGNTFSASFCQSGFFLPFLFVCLFVWFVSVTQLLKLHILNLGKGGATSVSTGGIYKARNFPWKAERCCGKPKAGSLQSDEVVRDSDRTTSPPMPLRHKCHCPPSIPGLGTFVWGLLMLQGWHLPLTFKWLSKITMWSYSQKRAIKQIHTQMLTTIRTKDVQVPRFSPNGRNTRSLSDTRHLMSLQGPCKDKVFQFS